MTSLHSQRLAGMEAAITPRPSTPGAVCSCSVRAGHRVLLTWMSGAGGGAGDFAVLQDFTLEAQISVAVWCVPVASALQAHVHTAPRPAVWLAQVPGYGPAGSRPGRGPGQRLSTLTAGVPLRMMAVLPAICHH